jgi:hypothetical protein
MERFVANSDVLSLDLRLALFKASRIVSSRLLDFFIFGSVTSSRLLNFLVIGLVVIVMGGIGGGTDGDAISDDGLDECFISTSSSPNPLSANNLCHASLARRSNLRSRDEFLFVRRATHFLSILQKTKTIFQS